MPIKVNGFSNALLGARLCSLVENTFTEMDRIGAIPVPIEVDCKVPSEQPIKEQVEDARGSAIVIAEHGTVSYSSLYTRDGSVLISIGEQR